MPSEKETTRVTWSRRGFKRCLCVYHFMSFFSLFFSPSLHRSSLLVFPFFFENSLSLSLTQLDPPRGRPRASREWFRFPRSDALRGWLRGLYEAQRLGLMGLMHREGWITFEDRGCLEFSVESFRFPLNPLFLFHSRDVKIQIPLMHYRKKNAISPPKFLIHFSSDGLETP